MTSDSPNRRRIDLGGNADSEYKIKQSRNPPHIPSLETADEEVVMPTLSTPVDGATAGQRQWVLHIDISDDDP